MLEKEYTPQTEQEFKGFLESIGDSIVVVSDEDVVKVHVHTNDPGKAISRALTYGSLTRIKIDNMREEHQEKLIKDAAKVAEQQKFEEEERKKMVPPKPVGFISVSIGEGIGEIFRELGVDYLIEGGQTMNPSTEDMLRAIEEVNAETIYILPNNKNIILAANQAKLLTKDKEVIVIPTKTVPQGITAMISYVPEKSAEENEEAEPTLEDDTPAGQWVRGVRKVYENITDRCDVEKWKALFEADDFLSLEEEENCTTYLLRFLMEHYKLPTAIWKLLDEKIHIVQNAGAFRERFPAQFVSYMAHKCESGEEVDFSEFRGAEDADSDPFLQYCDRANQALQEKKLQEAEQMIGCGDALGITHPVMEICRASLYEGKGQTAEAITLLKKLSAKYPEDDLIAYNTAEILWRNGGRVEASAIYESLREKLPKHYMANLRLTDWYYEQGNYKEAKKCAEENDGGRLFCYGSDIDLICVKMTVVNLMMNSVPGEVAWMTTLTMQHWRSYHIDLQLIAGVWLPILKITEAGDTSFIRKLENAMEDNSELKRSIQSNARATQLTFDF